MREVINYINFISNNKFNKFFQEQNNGAYSRGSRDVVENESLLIIATDNIKKKEEKKYEVR